MPQQDAVLAMTSGSDDLQGILNVVWEHLLPALEEGSLPPDPEGEEQLREKLGQLAISTVQGAESSPLASAVSGQTYTLEPHGGSIQSIAFNFETPDPEIILTRDGESETFSAGHGEPMKGMLTSPLVTSDKVAVSGAWEQNDTYSVKVIYYETPQSVLYTFRFAGDTLYWNTENRAAFAPRDPGELIAVK
jgi:hypothetical protein